jgi:hypothetical protein
MKKPWIRYDGAREAYFESQRLRDEFKERLQESEKANEPLFRKVA